MRTMCSLVLVVVLVSMTDGRSACIEKNTRKNKSRIALRTLKQVEAPVLTTGTGAVLLELTSRAWIKGPKGIELLATLHSGNEQPDRVAIWRETGKRYSLLKTIWGPEGGQSAGGVGLPKGFRYRGEYFIHIVKFVSGTGNIHEDSFFWIAPDGALHDVKFVTGAESYKGLQHGEAVLKGENEIFEDEKLSFEFGIWHHGDANCCPTAGMVTGTFKLLGRKKINTKTRRWWSNFQIVPAKFEREEIETTD
jgi:hypothetical protein